MLPSRSRRTALAWGIEATVFAQVIQHIIAGKVVLAQYFLLKVAVFGQLVPFPFHQPADGGTEPIQRRR